MTNPLHLPDERRSLGSVPNIQTLCITAQAFAPYGDLLVAPAETGRFDFVARFENHRPHVRTNIALVRCNSVAGQLRVDEMECHPFSSQTFLPLDVSDYLVVVALDDGGGRPDLSTLAAFRVNHPLGINYHLGTWHIGMIALSRPGTFALLIHEDGSADDCRFCPVEPFDVLVEPHAMPADF
jgi:ureidoglycolate lyase